MMDIYHFEFLDLEDQSLYDGKTIECCLVTIMNTASTYFYIQIIIQVLLTGRQETIKKAGVKM